MTDMRLRGRRILIVEDNTLLADAMCESLRALEAIVVGPERCNLDALRRLDAEAAIDVAVLDADLGGEFSCPVAERLRALGVPFLLATGHDVAGLPKALRNAPSCLKPDGFASWLERLASLLHGTAP